MAVRAPKSSLKPIERPRKGAVTSASFSSLKAVLPSNRNCSTTTVPGTSGKVTSPPGRGSDRCNNSSGGGRGAGGGGCRGGRGDGRMGL
jgi:hypothetical protein